MAEAPYTKARHHQFRGPTDSGDYNERIEENYKDLTYLYNGLRIVGDEQDEGFGRAIREMQSLSRMVQELSERLDAVEEDSGAISFYGAASIDNDRFVGTPYELIDTVQLSQDTRYGILTLPEVVGSSLSKLVFVDGDNSVFVPSTLEMRVTGEPGTADSAGATIDSNEPEIAVSRIVGRVWERNVVVNSPNGAGAEVTVYLKAPTDLFTTDKSNSIVLHPYPTMGCDILEVSYTTNPDVLMDDQDGYLPVNEDAIHSGDQSAVGWLPPGGWSGDEAENSGPHVYHFEPLKITGLRIKMRQRSYHKEGGVYVYTYGLSNLDLRYNKYLDEGKALIRIDAPSGETISTVANVLPEMWNVPEAVQPQVFSYRTIWETSFDSGIYTTTPVALSDRVWLEITLSKTPGGGTPALSGLVAQSS